ncbi:MAG: hypothetical protein QOH86_597 [Sphingomonadales bacterium]|jgi:hypothetical protein|nr:hypothetical protein [Sphingomonadales bacterium]
MAEDNQQKTSAKEPRERPDPASGESSVNSQVIDSIAAINTLTEGLAPSTSAAMLGLIGADSLALATLNAVARQQGDATLRSASLAAVCARLAGTPVPSLGSPSADSGEFVLNAEGQARQAILLLKGQASLGGEAAEQATAALARVATAAAPAGETGKARKSGGTAS